jgi:hypothetical protein
MENHKDTCMCFECTKKNQQKQNTVNQNDDLPNHIEEYLDSKSPTSEHIELFEGDIDNIDLRTDLSHPEIIVVNAIIFNSLFLQNKGIPDPYGRFINEYQRLKVSMDRKSRMEFVNVNKRERFDDNLDKFNSFTALKKVKE